MESKSDRNINTCDECNSEYYSDTSQMTNLCPECSHFLYGYKNCKHEFRNGRCIKCLWNGSSSDYIQKLKNENLDKSKRIVDTVVFLQDKYGYTNVVVKDHWNDDRNAIGLTEKTGKYLVYISTVNDKEDNYFVSLENPPTDDEMPYSSAGDFDNLNLTELENILIRHLQLIE